MGILDDAIREHLELIRRKGATDSEVARLEDEAFGPPTRPDEADFPESEGVAATSANGVSAEPALDEPSPEEAAAHEELTTLLPAPETGDEGAERVSDEEAPEQASGEEGAERALDEQPGTGLEEPTGAHIAGEPESEDMLMEPEEKPVAEVEHEEPAAEEHRIVEEAAPEDHEEPSDDEAAPEEATSFYDQSREELDIDLSLDQEAAAPEAPSEEHPVAEPEGTTPLEPPIESLDTVEHPFHEEIVEEDEPQEEVAPSDEYQVEEEGAAPERAEGQHGEEDEEESAEDVLADTPEFLKDAPEDDELWFEQGEPKDFDF
jgi:hypothetical protein